MKKYKAGQELTLPKKYHEIAYDLQKSMRALDQTIKNLSLQKEEAVSEFWNMTRNVFPDLIENYKVRFISSDNKFIVSYAEDNYHKDSNKMMLDLYKKWKKDNSEIL